MLGELAGEAAREADDTELRHPLRHTAAEERRDAREVDDAAPALLDHQWQDRATDVARPAEVHREVALP